MNDTWKSKLLVHSLHFVFEWFCASASKKLVVSGDFNSRNPEDCCKELVLVGKTLCSLCYVVSTCQCFFLFEYTSDIFQLFSSCEMFSRWRFSISCYRVAFHDTGHSVYLNCYISLWLHIYSGFLPRSVKQLSSRETAIQNHTQ